MSNFVAASETTIEVKANIQDILILTSAGLSFIKSVIAVGTYSYWHILLALIELACSALALSLFVIGNFTENDNLSSYAVDDKLLFLLAFSSSCIMEVHDVIFTYQTVRTYRKLQENVKQNTMTYRDLQETKKKAKRSYMIWLLIGGLSAAILPIITFWKSGWETKYFSPSGFSPENGQLLLISTILTISAQAGLSIGLLCTICNAEVMLGCKCFCDALGLFVTIPGAVLLYIVTAKAEEGPESGSLTFFLLITAFQAIEMKAELARFVVIVFSVPSDDESTEDEEENQNGLDFDEEDASLGG